MCSRATTTSAQRCFVPTRMARSSSLRTAHHLASAVSQSAFGTGKKKARRARRTRRRYFMKLRVESPLSDELETIVQRVIRCAIEVHRTLGPGLAEGIY